MEAEEEVGDDTYLDEPTGGRKRAARGAKQTNHRSGGAPFYNNGRDLFK